MFVTCDCRHRNPDSAFFCEGCGKSLETPAADGMVGRDVLGTYRIVQVLGRGGMSLVYLGRHLLTDQEVAVKVLPPELAGHTDVKARFIEEARTLGRLQHPNIVALYNFVEADGHLYLVMQYAEGEDFDSLLESEGRVSVADGVAVGIEVLRALEYAHERGVIHRDIKPSNIIIGGDHTVKVMDFGIAKIVGSSKLTQTGQTMGTVRYMSPEQVRGKQVDHRSDLYSLAVTLYASICGQHPFDGDNHFDIMKQHLTSVPAPPSKHLPAVPQELERALLKAMEKRVEARYQTAREFRRALEAVPLDESARKLTRSLPVPAVDDSGLQRTTTSRSRMAPVAVAAILVLLGGAAALWALVGRPQSMPSLAGGDASASVATKTGVRPAARLPALHRVARSLDWRVDRTYPEAKLRVLSVDQRDPDQLERFYARALEVYRRYLRDEGLRIALRVGPLNLALVSQSLLNNRHYWPTAKPNVDYPTRYQAPSATLYVQNGRRMLESDLPYGLALHFCARVSDRQLSNDRCYQLAEGFEKYLAKTPLNR